MTALRRFHFYIALTTATVWFLVSGLLTLAVTLFLWRKPVLNYIFGHLYAWPVLKIFGYSIAVEGEEHLIANQPCVYVSNHQSALDVLTYGSMIPHSTVYIGKKELLHIPVFGLFFWAAGNVLIDRKNNIQAVAGLSTAKDEMLRRLVSVWIFPEGTRNRGDVPLLPFKRGAFHLAIAAQRPLVAFVTQPLKSYFDNREHRIIPGKIRIRVLPPYETKGLTAENAGELSDRIRGDMLRALEVLEKPSACAQ